MGERENRFERLAQIKPEFEILHIQGKMLQRQQLDMRV